MMLPVIMAVADQNPIFLAREVDILGEDNERCEMLTTGHWLPVTSTVGLR